MEFTHFDNQGTIRMVDVSEKSITKRTAIAEGKIYLQESTLALISKHQIQKGNVITTASVAGVMAAKRTGEIIPLCHTLPLDHVDVHCTLEEDGIQIEATAVTSSRTGVEMEVLHAVSIAALTIYDMCKAVDKTMRIGAIALRSKQKERIKPCTD
jgi:cyclic pyranopterin monophosphate synthase